jgi:hypothetical protein
MEPCGKTANPSLAAHQAVLIDDQGEVWPATSREIAGQVQSAQPHAIEIVDAALSKLGFVHVCQAGGTAIVSLCPDRTHPLAMYGAFDVIARLGPSRTVVVVASGDGQCSSFFGHLSAFRWMSLLLAMYGKAKLCPEEALAALSSS